MTNGENLRAISVQQGIPLRTIDQVRDALDAAKKTRAAESLARLMLRHGRLTDDARAFVAREYPQP